MTVKRLLMSAALVFTLFILGSRPGYAQDDWDFLVVPAYLWIPGFSGDITLESDESSGDSNIMEAFEFGYMIHAEAMRSRRWGLLLDALYVRLGKDDATVGSSTADFTFETWLVDFGGVYRFYETAYGGAEDRNLALELLGGGRYLSLGLEFKFNDRSGSDGSRHIVDPIVGGRVIADLTRKLSGSLRGDVGGGVNTDLTWSFSGALTYRFTDLFSAWGGYRVVGIDFDEGDRQDKFTFKMTMHGPIIGLGFTF